ncbi:hypothetical protein ACWIG4_13810 [Streptomyces sp. NPDC002248]
MPQVAGSAVASVAAAIAASQLGVYGTVIGAGVMSIVATTGGSVFQHLFRRTGEQLRDAAGQVIPRHGVPQDGAGKPVPPTFLAHPERHLAEVPEPRAEATTVLPRADGDPTSVLPAADADPTTVLPAAVPHEDATRVLRTGLEEPVPDDESRLMPAVPADEATRLLGAVPEDDATRVLGAAPRNEATRALGAAREEEATRLLRPGADPYSAPVTHQSARKVRGWRKPLLTAVGVFAVSMAGITGYELVAGHSLSGGSGSTISKLGGNGGSHHQAPPEQPTGPASTGPTGSTEKSGNGSTSPTPGDSPSPSGSQEKKDTSKDPSAPGEDTKQREQQKPSPSTTPDPTQSTPGTGQESGEGTDPGTGDQGDTGEQQPGEGAATQSP